MSRKKLKKIPYKFISFYNFLYVGGNGTSILNTVVHVVKKCWNKEGSGNGKRFSREKGWKLLCLARFEKFLR